MVLEYLIIQFISTVIKNYNAMRIYPYINNIVVLFSCNEAKKKAGAVDEVLEDFSKMPGIQSSNAGLSYWTQ